MLLFLKWPVVPELDIVLAPAVESLVLSMLRLTFFALAVFFWLEVGLAFALLLLPAVC